MSELPDLSMYIPLIDGFLVGRLSAEAFTLTYMRTFQDDSRLLADEWFAILNNVFLDADEYTEPALRTGGEYEIDERELCERVRAARAGLRELGADC